MAAPARIVSLVPSLTETVAAMGGGGGLVGVTRYCVRGAPEAAERVGGTKNPELTRIVALRPDLVLANAEENRQPDIAALRDAGLAVHVSYPRSVPDVRALLTELAGILTVPDAAAAALLAGLDAAESAAARQRPRTPLATMTLVWRKPWMGAGPDTYVDDLLTRCGFANVLSGFDERYPRLDPALVLGPEVVLLPSEPYAFTGEDLPAVRDLLGDVRHRFVDGQLLTWHGPRTAEALRSFSRLAADLDRERASGQ